MSDQTAGVEQLVSKFERGTLTRRELVIALSALMAAPAAKATTTAAQPRRIPVRALDHVTLMVSDIDRTVAFYQRIFEMPTMSRLGNTVNLSAGPSCLGLQPAGDQEPRIAHFCLGVEGFDHKQVRARLAEHGIQAIVVDEETPLLLFTDPDGILVQVQDQHYCRDLGEG